MGTNKKEQIEKNGKDTNTNQIQAGMNALNIPRTKRLSDYFISQSKLQDPNPFLTEEEEEMEKRKEWTL